MTAKTDSKLIEIDRCLDTLSGLFMNTFYNKSNLKDAILLLKEYRAIVDEGGKDV